ncbi:MAG: DeoR/GlpR family DNA-binding transcription regulator [Pseudomonadota bacterium]
MRQTEILEMLRVQGAVQVDDLSAYFGLSTQTIRQDLRELGARGLLKRTHGGAQRISTVNTRDYAARRAHQGEAKQRIAREVAQLIPNGCSVCINIGTTTEQVARALYDHENLTVLTNNINIITVLSGSRSNELILAGGRVRQSDGAVVGENAVEFISGFKVDYAVIGASSLDADGAVLDFDAQEVSVARAILKNARNRVLVADTSKFEVNAPVRICDVAEVDVFVTDTAPPENFISAANAGQTNIIIAGEQ